MNFHDSVHSLVKSFKETDEYKEYMKLKGEISNNKELFDTIKEFKDKQKSHQMEYINSGQINEEAQTELQDLYSRLMQKEEARKLLELEVRLDVLLADMQKIVADGIKEIIEF